MYFSDGVLEGIENFLNLSLCILCTGTWMNWRRDPKWLAQNSQNRPHSGKKTTERFESIMIWSARSELPICNNS